MDQGNSGKSEEEMMKEWENMAEGEPAASPQVSDLDQNAINDLFGDNKSSDSKTSGIKAIVNTPAVTYERLPMLEVTFERLVRLLSTSLRHFTGENVEINIQNITAVRFGDYLDSVPLPAILGVFTIKEWTTYGLVTCDSALIYSIVDVLLGGRKAKTVVKQEGRAYTTIERKLVEKLLSIMLADLTKSFEPVKPVVFALDRIETNPRFVMIERPANAAILVKINIEMQERQGSVEFLVPYGSLEPVRDVLLQMFMGDKVGQDSIWAYHLAEETLHSQIKLDAILDTKQMLLSDVLNWEVGSNVVFKNRPDDLLEIKRGHVVLFKGNLGQKNKHMALKVEQVFEKGAKEHD